MACRSPFGRSSRCRSTSRRPRASSRTRCTASPRCSSRSSGSQNPRAVAVAFDLAGGTFRDELTEDYKGGRAETPPEIEHQFDLIRTMCETLHIPVLGVERFEADDVLATLATWGRDAKIPVVVVSGDRDTFQLVEDPFIKVLYNRRGVSDYSLYDEAGIFERCGIESARYPLLAALRGDTSDNLPGVPGVGEKTAAKLFAQYRDFDELYANLGSLTPKLRENLAAYEARARNNEKVMRLVRDVPLDFSLEDITLGGWRRAEVNAFFERYEMNSMRTRFNKLMQDGLLGEPAESDEAERARRRPRPRAHAGARVLARGGAGRTARRRSSRSTTNASPCSTPSRAPSPSSTSPSSWPRRRTCRLPGHDVKGLYRLAGEAGIELREPADDTSIMAFLVDAISGHYELGDVALRFLGEPIEDTRPSLFSASNDETLVHDVQQIARLRDVLRAEIDRWELNRIYEEVELPLVAVLGRMEARGIRVDAGLAAHDRGGVRHRSPRARSRDPKGRGPRVQGELAPAAPSRALRRAGLDRGEEDQVGVFDRRGEPGSDRRRAPHRVADPALSRDRKAPLDLRRAADRRRRRRRAHPRHVLPGRRAHRSALLGESEPAQHSRALVRGASTSLRVRADARAGSSRSRTTTRSNCASWRTSPRTRVCSPPSRATRTCTAPSPRRSLASRPRRSPTSSANGRRPSPTVSSTAWRPSDSADDSASRSRPQKRS